MVLAYLTIKMHHVNNNNTNTKGIIIREISLQLFELSFSKTATFVLSLTNSNEGV